MKQTTDICSNAVMLKKELFRENDLLVDLLVESEGMVKSIAFGAGSNRSSRGRCCQPFRQLSVHINKQIEHSTQRASYRIIEMRELPDMNLLFVNGMLGEEDKDLRHRSLACAYYINECYLHLARQFEHPRRAYKLYLDTMQSLHEAADKLSVHHSLRYFEIQILCFLGYDIRPIDVSHFSNQLGLYRYDLQIGWQFSEDEESSIDWQTLQCLIDRKQLDYTQLKCLQKHNQRLLNQLSNFKIQSSRDWLKSIYSTIHAL